MWRAPIEAPIRGAGVILTDSRNSQEPCRGGGEVNREGGWYSMKDTLCKLMFKAHGMNKHEWIDPRVEVEARMLLHS